MGPVPASGGGPRWDGTRRGPSSAGRAGAGIAGPRPRLGPATCPNAVWCGATPVLAHFACERERRRPGEIFGCGLGVVNGLAEAFPGVRLSWRLGRRPDACEKKRSSGRRRSLLRSEGKASTSASGDGRPLAAPGRATVLGRQPIDNRPVDIRRRGCEELGPYDLPVMVLPPSSPVKKKFDLQGTCVLYLVCTALVPRGECIRLQFPSEGNSMKKALVLISALLLVAFSASAAPVCAPALGGSPDNVLVQDFSCSVGPLTFSNFLLVNMGGSPSGTMTLRTDWVGSEIYLNFNPSLTAGAGLTTDEYFYFQVTGGILGVDLSVGGTGASITERVCLTPIDRNSGNNCTGGLANQLAAMTNASGVSAVHSALFPSASPVYIFKDILLQGPQNGSAELSTFSQSFTVPEPMTMALFGSGLLALGLVRRFRRS
jgi:hypothetical protein